MSRSKTTRLARHSHQMAMAVPQVVSARVGRMLTAGPMPSWRDQREFHTMGAEKWQAAGQAWMGMAGQAWAAQQRMAFWWWQAAWKYALGGWMQPAALNVLGREVGRQWTNATLDIGLGGLAPVHRRVLSNARRLRRTPR